MSTKLGIVEEGPSDVPPMSDLISAASTAADQQNRDIAETSESTSYTFESASKEWSSFSNKALSESWTKWDLASKVSTACVRISGRKFDVAEAPAFLVDLFNSPSLRDHLQLHDKKGSFALSGNVTKVDYDTLRTKVTNMGFFDRLIDAGAVMDGGYIRKKLDEEVEGITIGDLLRQAVLDPDNESGTYYDHDFSGVYSADERRELLYNVFRFIITGGRLCQPEDSWEAYLAAAKAVYRDLVTVTKAPEQEGGGIAVASHVYAVRGLVGTTAPVAASSTAAGGDAGGGAKTGPLRLFPEPSSPHNVCWVSVDPLRRTAAVLYHPWLPFW